MRASLAATAATCCILLQSLAFSANAHAQATGRVTCRVLENGVEAEGTIRVMDGARQVAAGTCGTPLDVPAGTYTARVTLDGALGNAESSSSITVRAGATENVSADIATAILELQAQAGGRNAAASGKILQGGREIGTVGNGVPTHVASGTYDIVVRYRTNEQRFDGVSLGRGERRVLSVNF